MTNVLRTVMNKIACKTEKQCKQTDGNPNKDPKEILKIKNTVTEIKNAFDGLIGTLNTSE